MASLAESRSAGSSNPALAMNSDIVKPIPASQLAAKIWRQFRSAGSSASFKRTANREAR